MQSKNSASVMVFAAVANDGKVIPLHFIEAGIEVNTAEYLKILKDVCSAHGAKKVQDFLKENLPLIVSKDIWQSNSPDLNVCDYWLLVSFRESLT